MNEIKRIKEQFERAFDGEAWYGDSLLSILNGIDAEMAAKHLFPASFSVWELVLHITFTEEIMCRRLNGEQAIIHDSEDFPKPALISEVHWNETLDRLRNSHDRLIEILENMHNDELDSLIEGYEYTRYHLIHGLLQHMIYHAAQIALIKKISIADKKENTKT